MKTPQRAKSLLLAGAISLWFGPMACMDEIEAMIEKIAVEQVGAIIESQEIMNDPGIHLILAGTGTPQLSAHRAPPCTAIIANGEFLIFDAGPAAVRELYLQGYPINQISKVFLTHMHSDHMGGIGNLINLSYINGRSNVMDIYGPDDSYKLTHSLYPPTSIEYCLGQEDTTGGLPDQRRISDLTPDDLRNGIPDPTDPSKVYIPGIQMMVDGTNLAYTPDVVIRTSSKQISSGSDDWSYNMAVAHPIRDMPGTAGPDRGWGELITVYVSPDKGNGELVVKAFLVDHYPCFPSYGFRIEYAGRTVVISGDTESLLPHDDVGGGSYWVKYAENADILVHEAINARMAEVVLHAAEEAYPELMDQIEQMRGAMKHHTSTIDLAKIAGESSIGTLVMTHIPFPIPNVLVAEYYMKDMDEYFGGEILIAEDGMDIYMEFEVPRVVSRAGKRGSSPDPKAGGRQPSTSRRKDPA